MDFSGKRVPSLTMVDYSDMTLPMVVVYNKPSDFPNMVVARIWDGAWNKPTDVYCVYQSITECREDSVAAGFSICIPRSPQDDKCIVGSYMR